ncbi:MAG: hypothetical protein IKS83_04785 [Victivallales bacterium]|nr:hypothetical protein [Victivallales bacterium]
MSTNEKTFPAHEQPFNGTFDDETRQKLHEKRISYGFSLQQLGSFLKIHWSTIRKWEAGVTTSCHPRHTARIGKFLDGGYDEQLRTIVTQEPFMRGASRRISLAANQCMERVGQTYQLCQPDFPDLGDAFLDAIEQTIQDTIREFLKRIEKSISS